MMLYTIADTEEVLEDDTDYSRPETMLVERGGVWVEVELFTPGKGRISRIVSTDPAHFLNPRYSPGRVVKFNPEL